MILNKEWNLRIDMGVVTSHGSKDVVTSLVLEVPDCLIVEGFHYLVEVVVRPVFVEDQSPVMVVEVEEEVLRPAIGTLVHIFSLIHRNIEDLFLLTKIVIT